MTLPQASNKRTLNIVTSMEPTKQVVIRPGKKTHYSMVVQREYYVDVDKTAFYLEQEPEFRSFRETGPDAHIHYHVWVENNLQDHEWCRLCGKVRMRP